MAQKTRKKVETKVREEAKKRRVVKEKKKKKRTLEYFQQLQNKVLADDTKRSQIMESKYKKVPLGDNRDHQSSKQAKEKQLARYCRDLEVKMRVLISVRDVYMLGRTTWCIIQDE